MIGKLICWLVGHDPVWSTFVKFTKIEDGREYISLHCPRCDDYSDGELIMTYEEHVEYRKTHPIGG